MSSCYITITGESIGQAIKDLAAKTSDLTQGGNAAERHFEQLIGNDGHPDITLEEKIQRLEAVRHELELVLASFESEDDEGAQEDGPGKKLSGEALLVLSGYSETAPRTGLDVPHTTFGRDIPSAQLNWAASVARGKLALVLQAIDQELDPPEVTFASYFEAYIDEIGEEAFDQEDDFFFISTSVDYLTALIENPEMAWTDGIEVPQILLEHVLAPFLEMAGKSIRLH